MTETAVERLRDLVECDDGQDWIVADKDELRAVLAVVEAAQETVDAYEDPDRFLHGHIVVLAEKLQALHTQASDEGPR